LLQILLAELKSIARKKSNSKKLSVFKGREATLNRAIFQILALNDSQTKYDIFKQVSKNRSLKHIRYSNVNKRVRLLEGRGYISRAGFKKTKAGFQTAVYVLNAKAYLAIFLESIGLDNLLQNIDDPAAMVILASFLNAM
jgi:hypothetical protein